MGEVVPLSPSPPTRGLFLVTWMIKKTSMAMVLSYKKIRRMLPGLAADSDCPVPDPVAPESKGGGPLLDGYAQMWLFMANVPFMFMYLAFLLLIVALHGKMDREEVDIFLLPFIFLAIGPYSLHAFVFLSVMYWYRDVPFRLMGANAKFAVEVIPVIVTAALRQYVVYNEGFLAFVLGCTVYFYGFAHYLHIAYDIGLMDVFLEMVMVVLVYSLPGGLLVRASLVSFCIISSLYRYMTYYAPQVPEHPRKQELEEQLRC